MPLLCFGGAFNPIHHGHLICARSVAEKLGYGKVLLIPSGRPPHKPDSADLAGAQDRLEMCRLAAAGQGGFFETSDIEIGAAGPSYTLETARALKKRGLDEVHWLIGLDTVPHLPTWHEPAALLREVRFVVMRRPGVDLAAGALPEACRALAAEGVESPLVEISATEIRRRVREKKSIAYLTPEAVIDHILRNGLYGA